MTANTQYEAPTWNQIYDLLLNQAKKIMQSYYHPHTIIAVSRGGLIPARILSDLLQTPDIQTIHIEFYQTIAQPKQQPVLKQGLQAPITAKKALLVDDISDSGKSLQLAKKHLIEQGASEVKIATLYTKPGTLTQPDFSEKETLNWVVFPWDAKETVREIIQKQQGKRAVNREMGKLVKAGLPMQLAERFMAEVQAET